METISVGVENKSKMYLALADDAVSYYQTSSLYDYMQFFCYVPDFFKNEVLLIIERKARQVGEISHFRKSLDAIYNQ